MRRPPKYTRGFVDRHGKARWYFRREGHPGRALPGLPWSPEFMAAYAEAMNGEINPKPEIGADRTVPGTFDALIVAFYSSATFLGWGGSMQRARRNILERFRAETLPGATVNNGRGRVAQLQPKHVERLMAARAATPSAARVFLKTLRTLMRFAIKEGLRKDDPTADQRGPKSKTDGIATWPEELITKFQGAHPIGSKARLAFALLLYTAQRRGDVVRMGWQHCTGDVLTVRQQKTGAVLAIPMHPELQTVLATTPKANMTFLVTEYDRPFSAAGFGNQFREWCDAAGIPKGYSAHGLRKAACRRLAEAGCTEKQIAAISGHVTLAEIQRYTKAADQGRLARSAMATAYPSANQEQKLANPQPGLPK